MKEHLRVLTTTTPDASVVDPDIRSGGVTATLVGFASSGAPLLEIPGDQPRTRVTARTCVPLQDSDVGREVLVVSDQQHPDSPVIIGLIHTAVIVPPVEITADGQSVSVRANTAITLKCGAASITLTRDGRVVIRGKHVVTQASGVNRIRGGSVQLN